MTKFEAFSKSAMEGISITHKYFTEDEFIKILTDGRILTEDGYKLTADEFNQDRKGEDWEADWEVYSF